MKNYLCFWDVSWKILLSIGHNRFALSPFCDRNRSSHKCCALTISIAHGARRRRRFGWRRHLLPHRKEEPSRMVPSNTIVRTYLLQVSNISRNDVHIDTTLNRVTVVTTKQWGHSFRWCLPWPSMFNLSGLRKENPPLEIALVLDVTRSMEQKKKMRT